jgi:phosphoribosyl-ATP pyrophosphohydrolase/phosphoribosyl-AMP cyclohydrolase
MPEGSYTSKLFKEGTPRIAQKVGEEGVEVALAAVLGDKKRLTEESADLLFHLLVLLRQQGMSFEEVIKELQKRMK